MTRSGQRKRTLARAVVDEDEPATGSLFEDRIERRLLAHEARTEQIRDSDIAGETRQRPVEAPDVLIPARRDHERVRTGIAFGKVEGLHRHLEKHFMAGLARQIDRGLRVERERYEAERDGR